LISREEFSRRRPWPATRVLDQVTDAAMKDVPAAGLLTQE